MKSFFATAVATTATVVLAKTGKVLQAASDYTDMEACASAGFVWYWMSWQCMTEEEKWAMEEANCVGDDEWEASWNDEWKWCEWSLRQLKRKTHTNKRLGVEDAIIEAME